ncbi:hypothetical protein C1886_03060 [Pseudomonas sp. FW300-N1A1]|nr:hypothetical protein C1886_03060 [Pseudomonas sp. FW300-N1A1]
MDLRTLDTLVPAITARGAIVEKGQERCKAIGDYLNSSFTPPIIILTHNQHGSGVARECGTTSNIFAECYSAFASKPAPTV